MKIAHISDLHLRKALPGTAGIETRLSRKMPELFAKALRQIDSLEPDLLVVTGDLIDYPLDEMDDVERREQGLEDLRLIAGLLAAMRCPVVTVHGNHDHPALTEQVFGALGSETRVQGFRVLAFGDDEQEGHVPRRIGRERRRFLDALADEDETPQIHVQHYVVWPRRDEGYPHTYGDAEWMRDEIVQSGRVRLVLSGHYHWGVPLFAEGNTYFATSRAFCEAPHPYALYEVEEKNIRAREFTMDAG